MLKKFLKKSPQSQEKPSESRRKFLTGASAATAGAAITAFPMIAKAQGPVTMRWQSTWPAKDIFHEYALDFAKKVNDMTAGELRIEVLPAGAVVPAFGLLDAVSKGTLDGGHGVLVYHYGKQNALALWGSGPAYGMDANTLLAWHKYGGGKQLLDKLYKSIGANVVFGVVGRKSDEGRARSTAEGGAEVDRTDAITVFTTRPDTLFGGTYVVLAPEHPLVDVLTIPEQRDAVAKYREEVGKRSERDRTTEAADAPKTGVSTGAFAVNPVNGKHIPIHGCNTGCWQAIGANSDPDSENYEYGQVGAGSSTVQFTELRRDKAPKGKWILTYSQSENPESKHYDDQTKLFSKSEFVPMLYTNKEIRSDPKLKITKLEEKTKKK